MADALAHLRSTGKVVESAIMAHTSPVGWEHIVFSGDFLWEQAAQKGRKKHLSSLTKRGQPECSVPVNATRFSAVNQRAALKYEVAPDLAKTLTAIASLTHLRYSKRISDMPSRQDELHRPPPEGLQRVIAHNSQSSQRSSSMTKGPCCKFTNFRCDLKNLAGKGGSS